MSDIMERIGHIICEIGPDEANSGYYTADQVQNIILGRTINSTENVKTPIDELMHINDVQYYFPIYSCRKFIGFIIVFFKKVFRKVAKFLIEPIVLQQNTFNCLSCQAMKYLENKQIKSEKQLREEMMLRIYNLQEELEYLKEQFSQLEEQLNTEKF